MCSSNRNLLLWSHRVPAALWLCFVLVLVYENKCAEQPNLVALSESHRTKHVIQRVMAHTAGQRAFNYTSECRHKQVWWPLAAPPPTALDCVQHQESTKNPYHTEVMRD